MADTHAENSGTNKGREALRQHRFKPGQSGNPGGRPKKLPITDRYLSALEQPLPDEIRKKLKLKAGAKLGDAVAIATCLQAAKGNYKAAAEVADRVEGKAAQRVELSVPEPITVHVVYDEDEG